MIRRFEEKDAQKVFEFIKRSILQLNGKDYPENILKNMVITNTPGKLISRAKKTDCFVYEEDDKLIGTVSLENNHVFSLYVDPDYIEQKKGSELMMFIENIAKQKYSTITLNATITAVGFYEKLGYKKISKMMQDNFGESTVMEKCF